MIKVTLGTDRQEQKRGDQKEELGVGRTELDVSGKGPGRSARSDFRKGAASRSSTSLPRAGGGAVPGESPQSNAKAPFPLYQRGN